MIRVTESMKFAKMQNDLSRAQSGYLEDMEKISSQSDLNRLSDDPIRAKSLLNFEASKASLEQYQRNIDNCNAWLSISEARLTSAVDVLSQAQELTVAQSNGIVTEESRQAAIKTVDSLIEEMTAIANATCGNKYIFGGTLSDKPPFSVSPSSASISEPAAASGNSFDGTVTQSGTYTGAANKTYVVKIVSGGALGGVTYQVSDDGGRNWPAPGIVETDLSGTVSLGEGVELNFTEGLKQMDAGDIFYVNAVAEGFYRGNGERLSVATGKNTFIEYSLSGESLFTSKGEGTVDVLGTLHSLKEALESDDTEAIASQLDNIKQASKQIRKGVAQCGTTSNRIEAAKNNLADMKLKLDEIISDTGGIDLAQVITDLSMKETALQACYSMISRVGQLSILDFIK